MARFSDKTVLITGGSGGIGKATAKRLFEDMAKVYVTGTNEEKLAQVEAELPGITPIQNDAGDPAAAKALAAQLPHLDAIFFNAGFGLYGAHDEITPEQYAKQMDVNVRGPMLQMAVLSGKLNDGGAVLFNTSVVQHVGMEGSSLYAASKAALRQYVRVLAKELAPRNIRVNAVSPGPIMTDFIARIGLPEEQQAAMRENLCQLVPLGRVGEAEEIANVAAFLLSKEASYMTGADVTVDGGMTMH